MGFNKKLSTANAACTIIDTVRRQYSTEEKMDKLSSYHEELSLLQLKYEHWTEIGRCLLKPWLGFQMLAQMGSVSQRPMFDCRPNDSVEKEQEQAYESSGSK